MKPTDVNFSKDGSNQQNVASDGNDASQDAQKSPESTESTQISDTSKESEDEPEYLEGMKLHLLVLSLLLVVLLMTLDTSIVSTAVPRITDSFHTIADIGWYGAAYLFTNSTFQPMAGKIYTFFPMKLSFIAFITIFELGSLLCATSVSSAMFIIGRAVAGIGSSGLVNGALTIVGSASRPEKKPMLMGLIMAMAGAGQLLGPLIGGALTEKTTWRWCFYINLPCGALTLLFLILIKFPTNLPRRKIGNVIKDFDLIGFIIFTPAVIMLMMALQWGGVTYAWSSAVIISLLTISGVMLIALVFWERHAASNAMFPPALLKLPVFSFSCATGFCAGGTILILLYYLPLWFQTVRSASPITSSIDTLPTFISSLIFAVVNGILCPRFIPYLTPFAIAGGIFGALGTGCMATFTPTTNTGVWVGLQILNGAGRGFVMQSPVQTVQLHISRADLPVGTAVVSFFQFFGGALLLALAQTLFGNLLRNALVRDAPGVDADAIVRNGATDLLKIVPVGQVENVKLAYNDAITKTLILSAGISAVGVFFAFGMGWKRVPQKAKKEKKLKEDNDKKEEKAKVAVEV